jgi:alpha-L-fucosidase 2
MYLSEQLQFNEKSLWTGGPGSAGYNNGNWTVRMLDG